MEFTAHIGSKGQLVKVTLAPPDVIHFIGISGTAMAGVAGVLQEQGFKVQGSDENTYPPMSDQLKKSKIPLFEGYHSERIQENLKLVVVGNSISSSNVEAQALMKAEVPYMSLPEVIRSVLIGQKQSLVVSGTHGKTTTSSMMAWLAQSCGFNPSFLIGGIPNNFNQSFRKTDSPWFIIEGDEYDTAFFDKRPKFIHYQPFSVILTRIEFDHVDIYENLEKVKSSFELLIRSLPQDGLLVVNAEDKNILDILHKSSSKKIVTYGVSQGDYHLQDRRSYTEKGIHEFSIKCPDGEKVFVKLPVFGLHNAMNALASFSLCRELGWDQKKILKGLSEFKGVCRRFQVLAEFDEVVLIEDFAHHPTAVRATIEAIRERYPHYDVISIFEPRSASSRRNVFQKHYINSFSKSDKVFVVPPYREFEIKEEERFSSKLLVKDLNIRGVFAEFHENTDSIIQSVVKGLKKKSVIVIMSNGPFEGIHDRLKQKISQMFN